MRFLVISDTHGDIDRASELIEQMHSLIDGVWHLGDHDRDLEKLADRYQYDYGLAFQGVPGNCDPYSRRPRILVFNVEGRRVMMIHGDGLTSGYGPGYLSSEAARQQADVVLFGHTHYPYNEEIGGRLYLNPGSLSRPRGGSKRSYAILEIENGRAYATLCEDN